MAESPKRPTNDSRAAASRVVKPAKPAVPTNETARAVDSTPLAMGPFTVLPTQFGRYQVEQLLGKGAMGAVYLAHDIQLDRPVALKVARVSAAGSAKLVQRMETEAKAAAQIDHPLICKVHDFGEIEGIRFIAMQYIEGEDLKSYLKRVGRKREPAEALHIILQMARALKAAHDKGVIHRDLKPENVMLNQNGEPVIMDFGLARRTTGATNADLTQGMILGTAAYMSPEQAIGKAEGIDQRSDLYALGVMLFEMLTGEWPFAGTAIEVMGRKCAQAPPSPLDIDPSLSIELAAVCSRIISQNKEDRYASCEDLIEALSAASLESALLTVGPERPPWLKKTKTLIEPVALPERPVTVIPDRKQATRVRWLMIAAPAVLCLIIVAILLRHPVRESSEQVSHPEASIDVTPVFSEAAGSEPTVASESVDTIDRTQFKVIAGRWRVEGEELLQTDANESFPILVMGDREWTDYELTIDMMRVEGRDQGAVGFRVSPSGFYMFGIGTTRDGNQCCTEVHEGSSWFTVGKSYYQTSNHIWYTVRVRVEGNHFECVMRDGDNDVATCSFTDNRLASGAIALRVFKSAYRFRNIKVMSLDGKTLWKGMPALP